MKLSKTVLNFSLLSILFTGCNHAPIYQTPDIEMPEDWQNSFVDDSLDSCFIWWETLQDPVLNELMALGEAQNLDLKIAAIHVLQSRAETNGKKADLYPHLDASLNMGKVGYHKNAFSDAICKRSLKKDTFNFYEIGFDAEWEIDFFGMRAHEIMALKAKEAALCDQMQGVFVTLTAEIAKNYVELRGYQLRLDNLQSRIKSAEKQTSLAQELRSRGIITDQKLSSIKVENLSLETDLLTLEAAKSSAIYRLAVLLGYFPGDLVDYLSCNSTLPKLPCNPQIGMPSELLQRRPDIRNAENRLAAATEQTASAIGALFPRFSLWGFIGDITTHAGEIFNPSKSAAFGIGPQILVPIFNSKLLMQDVEYNKLATQEALLNYQKTVLEALEEAENALLKYKQGEKKLRYLEESHQLLENTRVQEELLYQKGITDYLSVIEVSKLAYLAHDQWIMAEIDQLLRYIAIYKALGGNWECLEEINHD